MTTVDDFLSQAGGGKYASFDKIGDAHEGRIVAMERRQARDIDGNPKVWENNGDPVMQWVVDIATEEIDPAIPNDDGVRRLYFNAHSVEGKVTLAGKEHAVKSMEKAFKDAVQQLKTTGYSGSLAGCTLKMAYLADGEPIKRGYSAPKLYLAKLTAPTVDIDDF